MSARGDTRYNNDIRICRMTYCSHYSYNSKKNFDLIINKSQREELKIQYSSINQVNHNDIKDSHLADAIDNSNGNENICDEMTKDISSQIPGSDHLKGKDIEELKEEVYELSDFSITMGNN